jgi:hypothetical protein
MNMKKTILFIVFFTIISVAVGTASVRIEAKAKYFMPSEQAFKDIYGSGVMYGGEIGIGIWQNFELCVTANTFTKNGELTFTEEETTLKIMPAGIGIKYVHPAGATVDIYGGIGISYYSYKEENPIGNVSTNKIGYFGTIGTYVKVIDGLFVDLFLDYSYCKIKPEELSVNIGGLGVGAGIGFEF